MPLFDFTYGELLLESTKDDVTARATIPRLKFSDFRRDFIRLWKGWRPLQCSTLQDEVCQRTRERSRSGMASEISRLQGKLYDSVPYPVVSFIPC
jgi:hypothetical protein